MKQNKKIIISLLILLLINATTFTIIMRAVYKRENSSNSTDKLDSTQLAVEINSVMNFETSNSEGDFYIKNPENNIHNVVVEIYLKDTDTLIYKSKKLLPGEKIEKDALDKELKQGKYKAIAFFNAYDENGNYAGKAGVVITINIKE